MQLAAAIGLSLLLLQREPQDNELNICVVVYSGPLRTA